MHYSFILTFGLFYSCSAANIHGTEVSDACEKASKEGASALLTLSEQAIKLTTVTSAIANLTTTAGPAVKAANAFIAIVKEAEQYPNEPLSPELKKAGEDAQAHINDIGDFVRLVKAMYPSLSNEQKQAYDQYQTLGRAYLKAHDAMTKECGAAFSEGNNRVGELLKVMPISASAYGIMEKVIDRSPAWSVRRY